MSSNLIERMRRVMKLSDTRHWSERANYPQNWSRRAAMAATHVKPGSSVIDIGCGPHFSLQQVLPTGCIYSPADLKPWNDQVQQVDLNQPGYPHGEYDVIAMLGVLEYLFRPQRALRWAAGSGKRLLTSYCHPGPDSSTEFRSGRRWVNAYTEQQFLDLLQAAGWQLVDTELYAENPQMRQFLYIADVPRP